jgi:hypothetical protein
MATIERKDDANEEERRTREPRAPASREIDDVKADLATLVADHPVGVLAAAVGLGYVVGGGLFTPLTSRVLRLGLRLGIQLAVVPMIEHEAASLMGLGQPAEDERAAPGRTDKGRTGH